MNSFGSNFATTPTPTELEVAKMELPKIRLRGSIFFYTPRPLTNPRLQYAKRLEQKAGFRPTSETAGKTVTLIYRGRTYERKL
jgi:hypothetical protein